MAQGSSCNSITSCREKSRRFMVFLLFLLPSPKVCTRMVELKWQQWGLFLGGFQVYGFKRVTSTWLWLILAIYVSWAKRKFLLDTSFPASKVFIFLKSTDYCTTKCAIQFVDLILLYTAVHSMFTVLTFC